MFSNQITFVLFTFNEESRVERAVRNFLPFGRVLVVDNYSTDRTIEIAMRLGAEVLQHKNTGWVEDEVTTRKVINFVRTSWIYWGYADEMVSGETLREITNLIESGKYKIISIARKNYYYGKDCRRAYAGNLSRVFEKGSIDFAGNVIHYFGKPKVDSSKIYSMDIRKYYVHHFISNTTESYINTTNRYTNIDAKTSNFSSMPDAFIKIVKTFIGNYLVRGAYKAGTAGLFLSIQTALYQLLLAMKSYEHQKKLDVAEIESRNNKIRDNILENLVK